MTRTAVVTGATGLLGRQVLQTFKENGWEVVGTGFSRSGPSIRKLDLTDASAMAALLDEVNSGVKTPDHNTLFPDKCDADPDGARAINVEATRALAETASSRKVLLIYISTDYVFPGVQGEAPYGSDATTKPPNIYGQTKLDGEKVTLEQTKETHLGVVLRVPVLYGNASHPSESAVNILSSKVWEAQKEDSRVEMDDWAKRYPTNTEDVARVCKDIAVKYTEATDSERAKLPVILQFSSEDCYTKHEICQMMADILGLPINNMIAVKEGNTPGVGVQRPYDTHLSTKSLKDLGIPIWTQDFKAWWYVTPTFILYYTEIG